jgi:dTDP-4-dehydrorhamnose reductase
VKFLVVGGSGFLGRHLRAEIARRGYAVVGTTTRPNPPPGLVRFDLSTDRIAAAVPRPFFSGGPVRVVVAACVTPMDRCRTERDYAYRVNVIGMVRLIEDVTALGARVAFVSSSYVFDGLTTSATEDRPHSPTSAYGEHKSAIDRYVAREHPDSLVVRLDKAVGDDPAERHLFSEWWDTVGAGRPVACIAGQVFTPTLVDDAARGIVAACELGLRGVYHLAAPEVFARDQLARQFFRVMGVPAVVVARPQFEFGFADPRPQNSTLDSSRFAAATGLRFTPLATVMERFRARVRVARRAIAAAA